MTKKLWWPRILFSPCSACLLLLFMVPGLGGQGFGDGSVIALARHPSDVFILPTRGGWILESDGTHQFLFRTYDEGRTWSKARANDTMQVLFFLDNQHGWSTELQQDHYSVVVTSDGGMNWSVSCPRLPGGELMITNMVFADLSNGWIIATQPGGLHTVLETTDGGRTFASSKSLLEKPDPPQTIFATPDSSRLWAIGEDSVLHSTNLGQTWLPQVSRANLPGRRKAISFRGGYAFKDGRVIIVGQSAGGVIFKSNNFGIDWRLVSESDEANWFDDIQFWDDRHGCAVGGSTLLFCTADGGDTWQARNALPKSPTTLMSVDNIFQKIFFASDGMRGWVVAAGGFLFETIDGGNSWRRLDLIDTADSK
jgi:photosystem II stability/assembly factor-like uncharacterized protein